MNLDSNIQSDTTLGNQTPENVNTSSSTYGSGKINITSRSMKTEMTQQVTPLNNNTNTTQQNITMVAYLVNNTIYIYSDTLTNLSSNNINSSGWVKMVIPAQFRICGKAKTSLDNNKCS